MNVTIEQIEKRLKNTLKYQRISPFKLRRLANLIRGKNAAYSIALLNNLSHKGSHTLKKLIINTLHNAKDDQAEPNDNFYIHTISIDEGKKQKKVFPRARSRMDLRVRHTSHINLILQRTK